MPTLSYVDLFAGAGGLSVGLERVGFELAHAVEIDRNARTTFLANRDIDAAMVSEDIRAIPRQRIKEVVGRDTVDLVAGGPPCQGFSEVGKRDGRDDRNHLFTNFIDWVDVLQPRAALFENVRGMSVTAGGSFLRSVTKSFGRIGYKVVYDVLRAADFGVPQLRRRIVILAVRDSLPDAPLAAAALTPSRLPSVSDAIDDLPPVLAGGEVVEYAGKPRTQLQADLRGSCKTLTDHRAVPHPAKLVEAISYIPDGGNRRSIPPRLQPNSGFHNSYARLRSTEPAVAITSNMSKPSSARCIHPFQHRGLTTREGARLQTFPDAYTFFGGDVSKRLQIGNAVPPYLAEALGIYVKTHVFGESLRAADKKRLLTIRNGCHDLKEGARKLESLPPLQSTLGTVQ